MIPVRIEEDKDRLYSFWSHKLVQSSINGRLWKLPVAHRWYEIYNRNQTETDIVIQKNFKREDFAKIVLMIIGTIICIFLGSD